jgi:hypothetical protein
MNPPFEDVRPEQIAIEENPPPQLRKDGGKEIWSSCRRRRVGSRYGMCSVNCSGGKSPAAKNSGRRLIGDRGALEEALRRESARGVNEV